MWFAITIEGKTDTNLGANGLDKAIIVARETREKLPNLRTLSIVDEQGLEVWTESSLVFDFNEQLRTNTLISGQTHCGKTNLAMAISSELNKQGTQIMVVDCVGVWKQKSDIQYYTSKRLFPKHSIIYSLEGLLVDDLRDFVNDLSRTIWFTRQTDYTKPLIMVLEEAEIYCRNLKSKLAQELYRLAFSGRNIGVRMLYISPRISNIATEFVELSGQRFHGQANEENSLRKLRSMYNKANAEKVKTLRLGEFLYWYSNGKDSIQVVNQPKWENNGIPPIELVRRVEQC